MRKSILLLDDDPDYHELFDGYLELALPDEKFTFRAATNSDEASRILDEEPFTVIFVDYRLGAETGIEFIRNCALHDVDIPFVLLTGYEAENAANEALAIGAFDFMSKDTLNVETLSRCVRFAAITLERRNDLTTALRLAQDAAKAQAEFLGNMSHEFRTPLNGVIGFADILLHKPDATPEMVKDYAGLIRESGSQLLQMVENILALTREAGETELEPSRFVLQDFFTDLCERFETIAHARHVEFSLELPHAPVVADTDPLVLALALKPVIGNALKFTDPGGRVDIAVAMNGGLHISVTDTGRGMDAETLQQACLPFFHHESYMSRRYEGPGLGLSIAKSSVAALGGSLGIESEPDKGTCVRVTLPVEKVLAASARLTCPPERGEKPFGGGFQSFKNASD